MQPFSVLAEKLVLGLRDNVISISNPAILKSFFRIEMLIILRRIASAHSLWHGQLGLVREVGVLYGNIVGILMKKKKHLQLFISKIVPAEVC